MQSLGKHHSTHAVIPVFLAQQGSQGLAISAPSTTSLMGGLYPGALTGFVDTVSDLPHARLSISTGITHSSLSTAFMPNSWVFQ